jgi:hypothetical protein
MGGQVVLGMADTVLVGRTTSPCKKLHELPAISTDWQQTTWCPDGDDYDHGSCRNPMRTDRNAACPFDGVHGAGSPCGANIRDRRSTIGHERRHNPALQFTNDSAFTDWVLRTAPPIPRYYPRMKQLNAEGPDILGKLPTVARLEPSVFQRRGTQGDATAQAWRRACCKRTASARSTTCQEATRPGCRRVPCR